MAKEIAAEATIDYTAIPHFPRATAVSHAGQLVCGTLMGMAVAAMEGRFHVYEGYSYQQVAFPVRVMRALGAELLIVSNACGGMNPHYAAGDIVAIEDHINLMNGNPLIGFNDDALGPRFPDMCAPYDHALIERALEIARRENFAAHKGVYAAVTGPNLETRAEYRFLRSIGADVVGMSTVPEVLAAVHAGMRGAGAVDRDGPLSSRRPAPGQDRGHLGDRRRRRAETAKDRVGGSRPRDGQAGFRAVPLAILNRPC